MLKHKGFFKGGNFVHSVSDSLFLSKATVVSGDSFNIHANRGERDPVWKAFPLEYRGTLILAQITGCPP